MFDGELERSRLNSSGVLGQVSVCSLEVCAQCPARLAAMALRSLRLIVGSIDDCHGEARISKVFSIMRFCLLGLGVKPMIVVALGEY